MSLQTLARLKARPDYMALSPKEQMDVAKYYLEQEMNTDPDFVAASPTAKQQVLQHFVLDAVTFQDEVRYGNTVRELMKNNLAGKNGSEIAKQAYEGFTGAVQGSGILSFGARTIDAITGNTIGSEERKRALEYFKAADNVISSNDWAGEVGNVLGTIADVLGVSLVMTPATAAAKASIQLAARGGVAAVEAANAIGKAAPLLKPALNYLGPIAAEAAIEAVPYFLTEESRRSANGEMSVLSGGVADVAKTLGINAGVDFLFGTIATAALETAYKGGKILFGKSHLTDAAYKSEEEYKLALSLLRTGKASPELMSRQNPFIFDKIGQNMAIDEYIQKGILEPTAYRWGKTAYLAHDLGEVVGLTEDGSYRLWKMSKEGAPMSKVYTNLGDLEDTLSYTAYKAYEELPDIKKDKFLSAHTSWALPRGKVLAEQEALFGNPKVLTAEPKFVAMEAAKTPVKPISKRPVITNGEAYNLANMNSETTTVIQTNIDTAGDIAMAMNKGDNNLMRGKGTITVTKSDAPNAVFIGSNNTPQAIYDLATEQATKAIQITPALTLPNARASILLDQGFDHIRLADGSVEFFTPRNMKLIGTPDDVLAKAVTPLQMGDVSPITILSETKGFSGTGKVLTANEDLLLSAAVKATRSQDAKDLHNFVKLYTSNAGSNVSVSIQRISNMQNVQVTRLGDLVTVKAPAKVMTFNEEKTFVDSLLSGLKEAISHGPVKQQATDYWGSKFTSQIAAFELPSKTNVAEWLTGVTSKLGGTTEVVNGKTAISLPVEKALFATPEEATTWLSRRIGDEAIISNDLKAQGMRVMKLKDGSYKTISFRSGKIIAEGNTFPAMLDKMNYVPASIDISYGPKVLNITDGTIDFELSGTFQYKDPAQAFNVLQKYKDTRFVTAKKLMSASSLGELKALPDSRYEVFLSEFNARRSFDTLAEARDYLRRGGDLEIQELREMAHLKLVNLYIENNQYVIYSGVNRYTAKSMDDLKKVMKTIPDVSENVPNILDEFDPTLEASVSDLLNQFKLRKKYQAGPNPFNNAPEFEFDPRTVKDVSIYNSARAGSATFTSYIEDVAKQTNNPALGKVMAEFRDLRRISESETVSANRLLDTIFRDSKGKIIKTDSRKRIFYSLAGQNQADAGALAAQYKERYGNELIKLTPEESIVADKVKGYLDSLSVKFGIKFQDLIFNYMPKLRDLTHKGNAELLNKVTTADGLVTELMGTSPPKELKFWAENERTDEITRFMLKDDALEVLMLYTAQGNKKLYLNEAWKKIDRMIKETDLDQGVINRIQNYRMQIMSSYHTPGEKIVEDFGSKLFKGMKKLPGIGNLIPYTESEMETFGKSLLRNTLSMTYFSSMGWKPFLAIRNSFQGYTMAAPRVGVDWMTKGYKEVLDKPLEFFDRYRKLGILSEKPPIVDSLTGHDTGVGKFIEKSLESFKNSDDFTRAAVYRAGELRFDNALTARKLGQLESRDAFFSMSGLDVMDPTTQSQVWELVTSGNPQKMESAKDLYAFKLQRDSNFDYSGADTPLAFQGVLGKLFGQFGTYSAGYRANMGAMFKYGSLKKRVEMVGTYLAMTGLLYAGFEAARIKTNDFIPFAPVFFQGGPHFQNAMNILKATGSGYEATMAREALKKDLPAMLPGMAQYNYLSKAVKYSEEGDSYAALLSLTSVPVKPLW